LGHVESCITHGRYIFIVIVFLEHMFFVVLGVTGTEGQEIERFLGARKSARLLVGWENFIVSF